MTSTPHRFALPLAMGLFVLLLAGCKASEKITVDSVEGSGWIKCSMGQSYVNESGDDVPTGYGAATEAWKDYYCVNEDTGTLWWDRLEVYARKYNGNVLCETSSVASTTTSRSVAIQDRALCASGGSNRIWVIGFHGSSRNGSSTIRRVQSTTPEVTSN